MHFASAKRDLLDLLDDEVAENGNGLAVLAIDKELATASILVHGDEGPAIRLCHRAQALLHDVYARCSHLVRVPQVHDVDDELRIHTLK